jgi:hypothetical protein
LGLSLVPLGIADAATTVGIVGSDFRINGAVTYPGAPAQGKLLNVRMTNSTFEDTSGQIAGFDPSANTDEFIAAMPSYISAGARAFTLSLQGGNPGYEGAVNSAFNSNGTLKSTYLTRVKRVIQAADAQGAVIILGLFYQRQDQILANQTAVQNGVINVCNWIAAEGFANVMLEIANEYPHGGFDHAIIQSATGMVSLIALAKSRCPSFVKVSTSGVGDGALDHDVAEAVDFLLIHFNDTAIGAYADRISALQGYGKPIVVNEDPKEGDVGATAAQTTVDQGASWGYFRRANQDYPFMFLGATEDPAVYNKLRALSGVAGVPAAPTGLTVTVAP